MISISNKIFKDKDRKMFVLSLNLYYKFKLIILSIKSFCDQGHFEFSYIDKAFTGQIFLNYLLFIHINQIYYVIYVSERIKHIYLD